MRRWLELALAIGAVCALEAAAEPDTFGLGSGRDGALHVTASGTVVNASAALTRPAASGDFALSVSGAGGFQAGDLVMVLQTAGLTPPPAAGNPWPVGQWELARVAGVDGSGLVLTAPLRLAYASPGAQLVRVPEYTSVRIEPGAALAAAPWDGSAGGVVAFLATGDVINDGAIDASGAGARGGLYAPDWTRASGCGVGGQDAPAATGTRKGEGIAQPGIGAESTGADNVSNGGGAGMCQRAGGGGGGNGGPGGQGGSTPGSDGVAGLGGAMLGGSPLERLTLGGGGGAGHGDAEPGWQVPDGGRGGGIILLRAGRLVGRGAILARGAPGGGALEVGAGGGGAGGSISLWLAGEASCGRVSASGGAGGDTGSGRAGPGGGGGGGRVALQAGSNRGCAPSVMDVDAGLAGAELDVPAKEEAGAGAQPREVNASFYRGTLLVQAPPLAPVRNAFVPLNVIISSAPPNPSNSSSATFGFTTQGGLPPITVMCRHYLSSAPPPAYGPCTSSTSFVLNGLVDAKHVVDVQATSAGSPPSSASYTWTVDTIPPVVTLNATPPAFSNSTSAVFAFVVSEPGTTQCRYYQIGSSLPAFGPCTSPFTAGTLVAGPYRFEVRATDVAGNISSTVLHNWTVDTTPPAVAFTATPPGFNNSRAASLSFAATDVNTVSVQCRYYLVATSPPAFGPCTSPTTFVLTGLAQGAHVADVQATDAAGNSQLASASWTVDTVPPTTTIVSGPSGSQTVRTPDVVFAVSSSEPGHFECSLDGSDFTACGEDGGTISYTAMAEGSYTLVIRSVDRAGNVEATPPTRSWHSYLGGDTQVRGGGLSCSATGGSPLGLLGLLGLAGLRARRRAVSAG